MDRREFLTRAGLVATWAGVAITVSSCGEEDSTSNPVGNSNDVIGSVSGGGHSHGGAIVTEAELLAGNAVTLTLTGSGHTHTVPLSSPQVMDIADGTRVAVTVTDGHTHTVTFN
ncbi:MAG: hypothetical protein KC591_08985 [Gemmatimonadetes bacterium]|nr:hypothetical protein [Gemmatimonadota bacterium]